MNNSHNGQWHEWQIDKVTSDLSIMTPYEIAVYVLDMQKAIKYAASGLKGEYPWYIHGKTSQKEAREVALSTVQETIKEYSDKFV